VQAVLGGVAPGTILQAGAILGLLLSVLAVTLTRLEFGPAARRRRTARRIEQAAARQRRAAARARQSAVGNTAVATGELSPADLARLDAFRPRARLMADEPVGLVAWWRKLRLIWQEGHMGWVIAALVGSFSMATHFGAFWLITGGGWIGATAITVHSTAAMVGACAWIIVGLIDHRPPTR
jgi:hypothetical protein